VSRRRFGVLTSNIHIADSHARSNVHNLIHGIFNLVWRPNNVYRLAVLISWRNHHRTTGLGDQVMYRIAALANNELMTATFDC
jgi:hypothetical protein